MNSIAIFNNKGGVGKTTYLFHIAHLLADNGKKVLMVDCDSQCNLSAFTLKEQEVKASWSEKGNSIYKVIEPIATGTGDYRKREPKKLNENLYLVPGDINLSLFEDRLGETWSSASTQEISLRAQISIFRYIKFASEKINTDIVLIDLGPNLGSLNRAVLGGCDFFITPLAPDLFSIKGTENLGNKFIVWNKEWTRNLEKWKNDSTLSSDISLPNGKPTFLGYVTQQHNIRNSSKGMTQGWSIFGDEVDNAVKKNIVEKLKPINQVAIKDNYKLVPCKA